MRSKKQSINMLEGPFLKNVILFTVPIILTNVLQLAFNAADLIIVGQFCGSSSMAAIGATGPMTALLVNLFTGFSVGAGVSVAQAIGSGNERAIRNTIHTAIPTAVICGILLTGIGLLVSKPLLTWMDTPEAEFDLAVLYTKIYFCGSAASTVYNFGASILRAAGDTKAPLYFLSASGVLNVGLNTVFVTVFDMDVAGVALATILAQYLSAILVLIRLAKRTDACRLELKKSTIHKPSLIKIVRIGLPSGIQSSLFSIANIQIQSSINSFGSAVLAGNSAATNIGNFAMVATNSFHQAAVNFVGQNMGARKFKNIRRITNVNLVCATVCGLLLGGLTTLLRNPLLGIYIPDSAVALQAGAVKTLCMAPFFFLAGILEVSTGSLRGMGYSMIPMLTSVLGVCAFRILWIETVFRWITTPACLYISFPISWLITFLTQYIIFRHVLRKKEKQFSIS